MSFGRGQQRHVQVLTKIKTCGAHEVADIFNKHDIDLVDGEFVQCRMHHMGIEVAGAAGTDLHCGYALLPNTLGVVLGFEVPFDDRDLEFIAQGVCRCFEQRRFAGTRRRHQIYRQC